MTDAQRAALTGWGAWLEKWGTAAARSSAILLFLGTAWAFTVGPARDLWTYFAHQADRLDAIDVRVLEQSRRLTEVVAAQADLSASLRDLTAAQQGIAVVQAEMLDSIRRLSRPRVIFDVVESQTRPVAGYCISGEPCEWQVRIRRLPEAASCQLVAGSSRWGYYNPRLDTYIPVEVLDQGESRNIGTEPSTLYRTLSAVPGLAPDAQLVITASYTGCMGMVEGDAPIVATSEPIPFAAYDEPPPRPPR